MKKINKHYKAMEDHFERIIDSIELDLINFKEIFVEFVNFNLNESNSLD